MHTASDLSLAAQSVYVLALLLWEQHHPLHHYRDLAVDGLPEVFHYLLQVLLQKLLDFLFQQTLQRLPGYLFQMTVDHFFRVTASDVAEEFNNSKKVSNQRKMPLLILMKDIYEPWDTKIGTKFTLPISATYFLSPTSCIYQFKCTYACKIFVSFALCTYNLPLPLPFTNST